MTAIGGKRALCAALVALASLAAPAQARTVVSITFDDTLADAYPAARLLAARGIHATWFLNAPRLGRPGYLSLAQARALQASGNEIGGHTLTHADLPALDPAGQRRELCDDRAALLADGLRANVVAYPFGHYDAGVEAVARSCGYVAARAAGGVASRKGCSGPCPLAETIPPRRRFAIRTLPSVRRTTRVVTLRRAVEAAEAAGGGWVVVVLHHVCGGCDRYAISARRLAAFADWLAARASRGTVVRTIGRALASRRITR